MNTKKILEDQAKMQKALADLKAGADQIRRAADSVNSEIVALFEPVKNMGIMAAGMTPARQVIAETIPEEVQKVIDQEWAVPSDLPLN